MEETYSCFVETKETQEVSTQEKQPFINKIKAGVSWMNKNKVTQPLVKARLSKGIKQPRVLKRDVEMKDETKEFEITKSGFRHKRGNF